MANLTANHFVSYMKPIIYSLIVVGILLLGVEFGLRLWVDYFRIAYLTYNSEYERPVLVANTRINSNTERVSINSRGFVGPEFEEQKPPETTRIIALGDSCTFAGGWYDTTYSGMLNAMLNAKLPEKKVEVINAGISGYHSRFALSRLREELLKYDPDIVTIYIGWNDLMKTNPLNVSATDQYSTLAKIINQSYLMRAYAKFIFFYLRPLVMKPKLSHDIDDSRSFDNFVSVTFRSNLEAMLQTLQANDIQGILFTLPTVVHSNMTTQDIEANHVVFPYYAGVYSLDKFLSLLRSYNRVIKQVATKHNVPIVDLDAIFNKYHKDDLFYDTMHQTVKGNKLIANTVFDTIDDLVMNHGSLATSR